MSPLPETFLHHLREEGYNSRSNKHSNALALAIVHDLLTACPVLADKARKGEVVFELNFNLHFKTATWNVDLVLGRPAVPQAPRDREPIGRESPSTVEIAVEIKSVMTAHRKAVKNRKRDLEAHHEHVHNYDLRAIAGGVLVINSAAEFQSTLLTGVTKHATSKQSLTTTVAHCISELRNVAERGRGAEQGMDAKCALVLDMDNINFTGTRYDTHPPSPQVGDPLHYDSFLQRICDQYQARFGS